MSDPFIPAAIAQAFQKIVQQIVIPNNATVNTFPRVEIGFKLPADLVAFYNAIPETAVGGIVFWSNATQYTYMILVVQSNASKIAFGGRTSFGVSEAQEIVPSALALQEVIAVGEHSPSFMEFFTNGQLDFFGTSQAQFRDNSVLFVIANAILQIQDTAALLINNSAKVQLQNSALMQFFNTTKLEFAGTSTMQMDVGTDFLIDPNGFVGPLSQPKGLLGSLEDTANSASVGAATLITWQGQTTLSFTAKDGRAYEIEFHWIPGSSVVNVATYLLRRDSLSGAVVLSWAQTVQTANNPPFYSKQYMKRNAGAGDLAINLVLSLQASTGTTGLIAGGTWPRAMRIRDAGAAVNYQTAAVLT